MRRNSILILVLAALVPHCFAGSPLAPEQLLKVRRISQLAITSDGARVAFTVTEPPSGDQRNSDVWVVDTKTKNVSRFTSSPKTDTLPRWSPDGKRLAFVSRRGEHAQIYILSVSGGEAQQLTLGKSDVEGFEWSPLGSQIAYIAPDPLTPEEEKKNDAKDDSRVVDKDDKPKRLWLLDAKTGTSRALTFGTWSLSEAVWLPSGDQLVISATDKPDSLQPTNRIFRIATADGAMKEISAPRGVFEKISVSPDGKTVGYLAGRVDGPEAHDLYTVPIGGGQPRNLTSVSLDRLVLSYNWRSGNSLVLAIESGFRSAVYMMDAEGKITGHIDFEKNIREFESTLSGIMAFVAESGIEPQEVWLSATTILAGLPVTHFNEELRKLPLATPEIFRYNSFDSTQIEASLIKPPGAQAGHPLPLVVLVHGGPTGRWADGFEPWSQALASRGYAVFLPNIRGSTGYGWRFLEMNRADWGGGDFQDIMAGVDSLIARGIADPDRLGIAGWSYGGYMAGWAVTQTTRFKAAVSGAGMANLISEFGTEDASTNSYDAWFNGLPYEYLERYVKSSPVTYAKNARTPTLLLQGEQDEIDPVGQSEELYRALKHYGVETEMVLYPREGHGFREEKHVYDVLQRIIDWMDRHLQPHS